MSATAFDDPLLTPRMRDVMQRMVRAQLTPLHVQTPQDARAAYVRGADVLEVPKAALERVEDFTIPSRDATLLNARLYAAQTREAAGVLPVLLYLHGGGFTIGSVATHDILCRELARQSGGMVISLDYRLAPEHRFPTAHNDAWDALQWLAREGAAIGADSARLAVGGDSAGGTLAAACAIEAQQAGVPLALQLLIYPGCTPHQDTPSHVRFGEGYVIDHAGIAWFFDQYAPERAMREDWRFAPLLADAVEGVAPAWIGLAECDPLVDEGVLYADKLRMAGVPVALEIYRGVTHEFIKMGRALPEALRLHADAAQALREAWAG